MKRKPHPKPSIIFFIIGLVAMMCALASCSKDDIPADIHAQYKALDAPKILYACTTEYPYVLACALDGTLTPEACMDDAVRNHRLEEEVKFTRYGVDSTRGNLYNEQEMVALAEAKCMGTFEMIKNE